MCYLRREVFSQPVHVISGCGDVHHLHGATSEAEGERPERALRMDSGYQAFSHCFVHLPAPVDEIVHPSQSPLYLVLLEVHLEGDQGA